MALPQGRVVLTESHLEMQPVFILGPQVRLLDMEVIMTLAQQVVRVNIKIFLWTSQIFFTRRKSFRNVQRQ